MEHNKNAIVDVKVRIFMGATFIFKDEEPPINTVELFDSTMTSARIISSNSEDLDDLREIVRAKGNAEAINKLERTLITPWLEIELKQRVLGIPELSIHDGVLVLPRQGIVNSGWYKVAQDVVLLHNVMIDVLFRMYPKAKWRRIQTPRINTNPIFHDSSDFPWCLNLWKIGFREKQEWIEGFRFDVQLASIVDELTRGYGRAQIDSNALEAISSAMKLTQRAKATWPVGWEYLYYASAHLDSGEVRNTIIDLDIAGDFAMREYIRKRLHIGQTLAKRMLDQSSTGDLLVIAKALSKNDSEFEKWSPLKAIHDLRNEILHRRRRRFSSTDLLMVEKARDTIASLLGELL
jgi:hypothetical protein